MKKQAQPFAAPVLFWNVTLRLAVISCVVGDFPVPLSIPTIASLRGHHASLSRPARLSLAQGLNGSKHPPCRKERGKGGGNPGKCNDLKGAGR
jgi:hypothetical protein